jgi:hypothetical protein
MAILSRVLRRVNYKTPLDLPRLFPEYRKGFVRERIRTDAVLCDELYARVTGGKT